MTTANTCENELDQEWIELIFEARDLGISVDEIREFLNKSSRPL
ncbi:DNA-binding anti-repressor SinI [Bacillus sp. CH30_1T]|nr:anti-repressor SinI family protein [Bacillus sp. CH30_1T]KAA0560773.1 DNA-binding anti-repressor SinI [Bacillus sp. CH30_1T]